MNTLKENDVEDMMFPIQHAFDIMLQARVPLVQASILNVDCGELMKVYNNLPNGLREMFLPGEKGNTSECVIVHYKPAAGCLVMMFSEPTADLDKLLNELK